MNMTVQMDIKLEPVLNVEVYEEVFGTGAGVVLSVVLKGGSHSGRSNKLLTFCFDVCDHIPAVCEICTTGAET